MKRNIFSYLLLILFFAPVFSFVGAAQEVLVPLQYNSVIKQRLNNQEKFSDGRAKTVTSVCDTLLLPFVEDFSREGIYPDQCVWVDSSVFINDDFPVNPPSIGV